MIVLCFTDVFRDLLSNQFVLSKAQNVFLFLIKEIPHLLSFLFIIISTIIHLFIIIQKHTNLKTLFLFPCED